MKDNIHTHQPGTEDRIPPQAILAERSIIAGMIQSEQIYYKALSDLIPEHFYHTSHRKAFEFLQKNKACNDFYMIEKALQEDPELSIDDFLNTSYSVRGENEIKDIIEAYQLREIIKSCTNAINASFSEDREKACDISSQLVSRVSSVSAGSERHTFRVSELLPSEIERIEHVQKGGGSAFIETGIQELDKAVSITQSDVVVLGARPSNGKSTIAGYISRNICFNGGRVLVFQLDTGNKKEVSRALFATSKVNLHRYNSGNFFKKDPYNLTEGVEKLMETELYFDDTRRLTPTMAEAICQRTISEYGPLNLVIFDFLQNMRPNYKINNVRERVSHISEELHDLPKITGCPIFLLSQMSRYINEHQQPPNLNNLKESGDIEEDADIIFLLYYPYHYYWQRDNDKKEEKKNLLQLFIAKYKDGPTGYVPLNYFPETAQITDRIEERIEDDYRPEDWQQRKDIGT